MTTMWDAIIKSAGIVPRSALSRRVAGDRYSPDCLLRRACLCRSATPSSIHRGLISCHSIDLTLSIPKWPWNFKRTTCFLCLSFFTDPFTVSRSIMSTMHGLAQQQAGNPVQETEFIPSVDHWKHWHFNAMNTPNNFSQCPEIIVYNIYFLYCNLVQQCNIPT